MIRSSRSQMFKIGVLTGKHLFESLFNKNAGLQAIDKDSNTSVFL